MLDRREDGGLVRGAPVALVSVATPQLRGRFPGLECRRRRRGPKGLRAARGAQRITVLGINCGQRQAGTALRLASATSRVADPTPADGPGSGALRAPLKP